MKLAPLTYDPERFKPKKGDLVYLLHEPDQLYRVKELGLRFAVCRPEPDRPDGEVWFRIQDVNVFTPNTKENPPTVDPMDDLIKTFPRLART